MKNQITEKDMRLPDYEGFAMDFISEKEVFLSKKKLKN